MIKRRVGVTWQLWKFVLEDWKRKYRFKAFFAKFIEIEWRKTIRLLWIGIIIVYQLVWINSYLHTLLHYNFIQCIQNESLDKERCVAFFLHQFGKMLYCFHGCVYFSFDRFLPNVFQLFSMISSFHAKIWIDVFLESDFIWQRCSLLNVWIFFVVAVFGRICHILSSFGRILKVSMEMDIWNNLTLYNVNWYFCDFPRISRNSRFFEKIRWRWLTLTFGSETSLTDNSTSWKTEKSVMMAPRKLTQSPFRVSSTFLKVYLIGNKKKCCCIINVCTVTFEMMPCYSVPLFFFLQFHGGLDCFFHWLRVDVTIRMIKPCTNGPTNQIRYTWFWPYRKISIPDRINSWSIPSVFSFYFKHVSIMHGSIHHLYVIDSSEICEW